MKSYIWRIIFVPLSWVCLQSWKYRRKKSSLSFLPSIPTIYSHKAFVSRKTSPNTWGSQEVFPIFEPHIQYHIAEILNFVFLDLQKWRFSWQFFHVMARVLSSPESSLQSSIPAFMFYVTSLWKLKSNSLFLSHEQ